MSSLCKCCMEHSSKSFGNLCFSPDSSYVISKVSQAIGDSCTFEMFIIQSTSFCLNALLTFFVQTMHGLIEHVTYVLCTWYIKCPLFVEALSPQQYALDMINWSKSSIALTLFWSDFFDGDDTMYTILDTTKVFLSSFCFRLLLTDIAWDNFFVFFVSGNCIGIFWGKWLRSPP